MSNTIKTIKTIMSVGLDAILSIMSVLAFKTAIILYLLHRFYTFVCIIKTYPKEIFPIMTTFLL
jgi:hypothetical protein